MTVQLPPPPVLSCARLLEYAVRDDSVGYAGRTFLFVGGKEVGRVPCLALCEDKSVSAVAVLLFLYDEESSDLGCSGFGSVTEARDWAERTYPGISSRRVQPVSLKKTPNAIWTNCSAIRGAASVEEGRTKASRRFWERQRSDL